MHQPPLILHDTPIRLVLKIITVSLIFSLLFLATALVSGRYPAFDDGVFLRVITYDVFTFVILVIVQQIITLLLLLQWLKRYYTVDREGITVTEGIIFRKQTTIPAGQIRTIARSQDWLARKLHYGTITIELINKPQAVVMPYLTHPEQVIASLNIQENQVR